MTLAKISLHCIPKRCGIEGAPFIGAKLWEKIPTVTKNFQHPRGI